jgi:hypothetical protein
VHALDRSATVTGILTVEESKIFREMGKEK